MYIVVSNCLNESHVNKLYSFIHSFIDPAHVIYVAEGHNVGSETMKRYDGTETYSHVDNIKYSHVN